MYDDASQIWFRDRAIGQGSADGYSLKGRYSTAGPNAHFDTNKMVGQTFVRSGNDEFMPGARDAAYYNGGYGGWAPVVEPSNNTVNPTQVYGSPAIWGVGTGLITVVIAGVLIYLVVKFWGD